MQALLAEVAGKPEAQLVNTLLLRSLKQARYSSENLGHYGLAFENYLHFTSPIRRYPDLVVHRVVRSILQHRLSPTLKERMRSDFPQLAEHASDRERVAESAERDLTRYYHARWAKEHIGEAFVGVIVGVTNFGVFVALANGVEGLMHVSQLDDDYYIYIEDSLMLMGKHTRKRYRMGDRVEVKVLAANPTQRQIDLVPASMEVAVPEADEKAPAKRPKKLRDPSEGGIDAEFVTGRRSAPSAAAKAADEAQGKQKATEQGKQQGRGKKTSKRDDGEAAADAGKPADGRTGRRSAKSKTSSAGDGAMAEQNGEAPSKAAPSAPAPAKAKQRKRRRLVFGKS